ncbi:MULTISPECIES: Rnf-Nqr domain containing protein [unclassified Pseudomonas]|uniref:Rnf-Nqr domain containing protein n=1 Tax=unclassified Pseudomonas TaxID=196821 RepID=UPI00244A797D|nr:MULTISPECIES: Rnf-Nqr domain containing protein [unclassified Pseudomonas]MDG9927230.1 NADH:quinone oxidoreductase [Pseudomonas sp. GD04042]MDH0485297.1 NADH:quinone oxidoreductase [Pseudomonas sp. GD04015]MDH0602652.1 NADH:quinone oxidoreductase [Pseudomonas sp. GD03869]
MKRALPLLALAPLLGATDLLVKGLGIGVAGLLVTTLCGLALAPLRGRLAGNALLLAALLLGGILASAASLVLQLLSAELASALALFLPLLILPCLALALGDSTGALAGLRPGLLFALAAVLLGALRETFGHGSLFAHADWLPGPALSGWQWSSGMPLLTHAAGAFILLGLLLALFRHFNQDDAR